MRFLEMILKLRRRKVGAAVSMADLCSYAALQAEGEQLLGTQNFFLLVSYGRLMGGPHSGSYVSSRPINERVNFARRLIAGEMLNIHLMHRHVSGKYDASTLCWRDGRLVMVFDGREEIA